VRQIAASAGVSISPSFGFYNGLACLFPVESRFDSCNRLILVHFINGRLNQTSLRSITTSEHVTVKCHLRLWIDAVVAFDSDIAAPTLRLIAKRATKLKALIFLKITNRDWNYHPQILIQFFRESFHSLQANGVYCDAMR